jgi:hypothetical protein
LNLLLLTVGCVLLSVGFSARQYRWATGAMFVGILHIRFMMGTTSIGSWRGDGLRRAAHYRPGPAASLESRAQSHRPAAVPPCP